MTVPATNNGQEGSNRRFGEDFGVHSSLWSFILTMNEELENSNDCFGLVDFVSLLETDTELLGCMVTMLVVLMGLGMVLAAIARFLVRK